ncbi:S41 family peptidase [Pelagicoccus albus]|uniref:PDZ domain-containing protein n=1 Tax=Pelagicoccus albus TaxID=415222 RepID=A0A7X1E9S6_9BACT|nr:S41 family peptidase [Pelagicoccus albus]MBC2607656.1 PDZ domain-containing protein [Pelagicoccus albus]
MPKIPILFIFLLVVLPSRGADELDSSQKERLIEKIGAKLDSKAFAFDTDFSRWRDFTTEDQALISEAKTKKDLAKALNHSLRKFEISHLGISAPSAVRERRAGLRTGIGITIHPLDEGGFVSYVLPLSPAKRTGLEKGDIIETIDGEALKDLGQLAGVNGQKRILGWKRGSRKMSGEVTYAPFPLFEESSMTWLNEDVAIIKIQSFHYKFYKANRVNRFFRQARKAKAIIIDLRNNRGGLSINSRHLASKISRQKETFARIYNDRSKRSKSGKSTHPLPFSRPYKGKVVVLVDSTSASAADIFPAFVSESGRGTVIGQRTSGALQLARHLPLPYGFRLYVPISEMLTPKGLRLEAEGFPPDLELTLEQTVDDEYIFEKALQQIESTQSVSE